MNEKELSEKAQNLRDNWEKFEAKGLAKIAINVDRIYEAAKWGNWEDAVKHFDKLCEKVAAADLCIREEYE